MSDPISSIGRQTITQADAAGETNTTVWQVQQSLNLVAGRRAVPESGVFDDATRRVLRNFQSIEGLRVTGQINQPTIERLNLRADAVRREQAPELPHCEVGEVVADRHTPSVAGVACTGPRSRGELAFAGAQVGGRAAYGAEVGVARERRMIHESGGWRMSVQGEALTAQARAGLEREDGSRGLELGVEANILAASVEVETPDGESAHFGLSAGPSAGASYFRRDRDLDGRRESCVSFSAGPISAGACIEDESY